MVTDGIEAPAADTPLSPPEATADDVDTRLGLPEPPVIPPKKEKLKPVYRYLKCSRCGGGGTLHRIGKDYVCERCVGTPRKGEIKCQHCGTVLVEKMEDGGKRISGSIVSRGGKVKAICPKCGRGRRIRKGRL